MSTVYKAADHMPIAGILHCVLADHVDHFHVPFNDGDVMLEQLEEDVSIWV